MKKCLLLLILLFSYNVYATNDIYIDSVSLIDKSDDVISYNDKGIDLTFNNPGERARYKIRVINNTDKEYSLDKDFSNNYLNIMIKNNQIKKKSINELYIDISYDKLLDTSKNYSFNDDITFNLQKSYSHSIIYKSIIIIVLIMFIIINLFLIYKIDSRRVFRIIIIGICLIPLMGFANNRKISLKSKININYNYLIARCINKNTNCIDFNKLTYNSKSVSLITKKNKMYSTYLNYDNKIYSLERVYDVSNYRNNQIMMGIYKTADNDLLLNIGQTNGVVANNNLSYFFKGTNFITYDLSSFITTNTTNMSHMFDSVNTKSLDLSSLDTGNVKDMSYMFYNSRINDLNISNFKTNSLINNNYMFSNSNFINIIGYKDLDLSNVNNKLYLFKNSKYKRLY